MEVDIFYVLTAVSIVGFLYYLLTKNNGYFHDKPIPSMAVKPIVGSAAELYLKKRSFSEYIERVYNQFAGVKVFGLFDANIPMFVIREPELIKRIGVKDFEHFMDHRPIFGTDTEHPDILFPKTLFALTDQKWKNMRATLSPAFTGSKMRQMFDLVVECSENMVKFYQNEVRTKGGKQEYEMKDVFSRFTNDVIATCAFGIKVDSSRDQDNEFYQQGKRMMQFGRFNVILRTFGYRFVPSAMDMLGIDIIDSEQNKYFATLIRDAVQTRESHGIVRPDMVNLLIEARKGTLKYQHENEQNEGFATVLESDVGKAPVTKSMTETEMIAQCLIFFLAGFDTVSTCLTFLAYELTVNPEAQEKLYQEIMETKRSLNGKPLTYDALQTMKYMDMAVTESLRMWPPVPAVDRLCVRDYVLDDGEGLKFTIDKGTGVWFPVQGLHHDPKFYPNPKRFTPERFSDENKASINPDAYLPFGVGPRNCIGSRFALMEVKAIVYYMLMNFSFEKTANTQVPLQLKTGLTMSPEKGVFVNFKPRRAESI